MKKLNKVKTLKKIYLVAVQMNQGCESGIYYFATNKDRAEFIKDVIKNFHGVSFAISEMETKKGSL